MAECVFCDLIARGDYIDRAAGVVTFEPLNPAVPGHLLVVPAEHVRDALESPTLTAVTMIRAVVVARERGLAPCNIMTSVGAEATQSVFHLHIHIVPRKYGDGLILPWTEQQARDAGRLAASD